MLGSQECIRNNVYSRLNSVDAGGDDSLKAEWDLWVSHTSTKEKSCWVQVDLYCQDKPSWVFVSLRNNIDCQSIFTGVLTGLSEYLLSDREDDICAGLCVISSDIPLATSSVGHQECLSNVIFDEDAYMKQPPGFSGMRRFAGWISHSTIWNNLRRDWLEHFASVTQELGLCRAQKDHSMFWRTQDKGLYWFYMWMIL